MTEQIIKTTDNKKKNKQKIIKYLIINIFLILFASSLITNIIYLPKYYGFQNHSSDIINLSIQVYDDTKTIKKEFPLFNNETKEATLGNLMAKSSWFELEEYQGLGRMLVGVYYLDEKNDKKLLKAHDNYYWRVDYKNTPTNLGIDSIFLNNSDEFQLHFTTW